jgi:ABC-type glycerol-3-phosphate transport system substrate-binding protein
MSKFQVILLCIFGFFLVTAVLVFALYRGSNSYQATVVVWGSLPYEDFNVLVSDPAFTQDQSLQIKYEEKSAATLEEVFTNALAEGRGPDLIILKQDQLWKNRSKLVPIPYESISARDFQETFIEGGDIYLLPEGIYGLPLLADPLVLYYNRDLLSAGGIAKPIGYWDEIFSQTSNITKRDPAGNLIMSTAALGETRNITNYKDILTLLMLQAGTSITNFVGTELRSQLTENLGLTVTPAEAALEFYTQFSNPTKSFYSWNRVLPEAQTRFSSGDLAYYLGFASEMRAIRSKNPTLNFSVAPVPQSRVSGRSLTVGKVYTVSMTKGTKDITSALLAAWKLAGENSVKSLSAAAFLPPARRDLLSIKPTDNTLPVFYTGALQIRSWIDPNPQGSARSFADMIDTVTSGRGRISEVVSKANGELDSLIK